MSSHGLRASISETGMTLIFIFALFNAQYADI
jgi:hypothetical protein